MVGAKRRCFSWAHSASLSPLVPAKAGTQFFALDSRLRGNERLLVPSPHFFGDLHDHLELRPLLVLGEDIAFLGRGEAALRRQAELLQRYEFRGLVDAALELVLGLQP